MNIEQLLSYLAVEVAQEFKVDIYDAIEIVCLSPLVNNIVENEDKTEYVNEEDIKNKLFEQIRIGE